MTKQPRAIVLSFDRLSRRCLGCYGHEWIETPNLDRLASRGIVFDQHFVSPAWRSSSQPTEELCARLHETGIVAKSLVERSSVIEPTTLDELPFARLVAEAEIELAERARDDTRPWLLWLTSAGIDWPCVALDTFAELYADELASDDDGRRETDAEREVEVAYAACVTQLDHVVGRLLTAIERLFGDDPPLLIVTAWAGESLGESEPLPLSHVNTAPPESASGLRDELIHTPLMVADAGRDRSSGRRQELTAAADLPTTIRDWFGLELATLAAENSRSLLPLIRDESTTWRESLTLRDLDGSAALRTPDYLLVQAAGPEKIPPRLYLKPEDTWEINDVAEQHEYLVAELFTQLDTHVSEPN